MKKTSSSRTAKASTKAANKVSTRTPAKTIIPPMPVRPQPTSENPMRKFLPYVCPAIVLAVLVFLGYRWYMVRTQRDGKVSPFADSVTIENLNQDDAKRILRGVGDVKTAQLTGAGEVSGEVRYEVKDGKVNFSVIAELPELKTGEYKVWIQEVGSESKKEAFALEMTKGGYVGSAAVPESTLPFMVIVTQNDTPVLSGQVNK